MTEQAKVAITASITSTGKRRKKVDRVKLKAAVEQHACANASLKSIASLVNVKPAAMSDTYHAIVDRKLPSAEIPASYSCCSQNCVQSIVAITKDNGGVEKLRTKLLKKKPNRKKWFVDEVVLFCC
jgi:hypothetical protein